jgi:signal transduction histidine kinase
VFRAGSHELRSELHDEHVQLRGNPLTIEQIFVNLLVNATEASSGPVHIHITSERVGAAEPGTQPWRRGEDMVLIRVADDGPGIPAELAASAFEPFVTSKPQGTGLGLTIAREAAQSLGGHLALEDSAAGCVMAVVLPAARSDEASE